MCIELGRRLIASGAISRAQLKSALMMLACERVPLAHALIVQGAISAASLDQELAQLEFPTVSNVVVHEQLFAQLPANLCRVLLAVPVRLDARTSTVDVAAVDPSDPHIAAEFSFHLGLPVRLLRASLLNVDGALDRPEPFSFEEAHTELASRSTMPFAEAETSRASTPAFGSPITAPSSTRSDAPIPLVRKSKRPSLVSHAPSSRHRARTDDAAANPLDDTRRMSAFDPAGYEATTAKFPLPPAIPKLGPPFVAPSPSIAPADLGTVISAIKGARSRDQVINLLVQGMRLVARRVAVFAVKKDHFIGWSCSGDFPDPAGLLALRIPSEQPSVLATAASRGWYLGPLPATPIHTPLANLLPHRSAELSIVAVRVTDRPVVLIVSDELGDTMIATRTAETLASAAGASLLRLIRAEHG